MSSPFLPPNPDAPQPPAPTPPAARTTPGAPEGARAGGEQRRRDPGGLPLGLSAGAIGVLALSYGGLFPFTILASALGWAMGVRVAREGSAQGRLAVALGVAGVVLGVAAGAAWITLGGEAGADRSVR